MFCYQESVSKGAPKPCTEKIWDELIDSSAVKNLCEQIAALDVHAADYNDRKQALKKQLPIIIPHASYFANGKRVSADAQPSGLAMLDVDHVEDPRGWWNSRIQSGTTEESLKADGIYLIAITASGHGLRILAKRGEAKICRGAMEPIRETQMHIAKVLDIDEYDTVTVDLARASYVVPREYILYEDREELFKAPVLYAGLTDKKEKPDGIRQNGQSRPRRYPHSRSGQLREGA